MTRGNYKVHVLPAVDLHNAQGLLLVSHTLSGISEECPETKPDQPQLSGIREVLEDNTWIWNLSHHYDRNKAISLHFKRKKVRRENREKLKDKTKQNKKPKEIFKIV